MKKVYPWWYYFSWWYFVWVVLYLTGATTFSPYMLALGILIYTILKIGSEFIHYFFINKKSLEREQKAVIAIWLSLVLFIDVLPFFILKPDYSIKNFYFTLLLIAIYLGLMWYKKVDVFHLYTFQRYLFLSSNYTPKTLLKAHFPSIN